MNGPSANPLDDIATEGFPLAVLMRRGPSHNRWISHSWQAIGVIVTSRQSVVHADGARVARHPDGAEDFLWGGFRLKLHRDEAESYYHNLMSARPSLFVICRNETPDRPKPFRVTACFDEANAFVEGDDDAQSVPMPPEIHQWIEQYVVRHYVPQPRHKRQRRNWKDEADERH